MLLLNENESKVLTSLYERFRLEPRKDYVGSGKWLVVYDKLENRYITDSSGKAYKRFKDTDEIFDYLKSLGLV